MHADLPLDTRFTLGAAVTAEQRAFLDRHGFLHFRRVARPDEVAMITGEMDRIEQDWLASGRTRVFGIPLFFGRDHEGKPFLQRLAFTSVFSEKIRAFVRDPRFAPILDLVGADARIGDAEKDGVVINRYLNVPGSVYPRLGWHTDGLRDLFYGRMPQRMLNIGLHLDRCTRDNGGLRLIPGSHTQGFWSMCFRKPYFVSHGDDPRGDLRRDRARRFDRARRAALAPRRALAARRRAEPAALDVPAVSHGPIRAEERRQPDAVLPPAGRVGARAARRDVMGGDRHAVVAGAGIGGAAVALLLANAGWHVTLFERVAEPRAVGAGILLQPNGLAVLYGLGLRDALRRRAREARGGSVADAAGRVLLATAIPDFGGGYDHMLALRRSHLQAVLLDAVAAHAGITCRFGCEVTSARADGMVTWNGGTAAADLVVGADGLHSRVRDGGAFGARLTPGITYLRGLGAPGPRDGMTEYWTSLGIYGGGAVDGAFYFYASTAAPAVTAALARRDVGALAAAWEAVCPPAGDAFRSVERFDDLLVSHVTRVDCERWSDGRVVLLGDAAHAMAPNAGQGANSALVDGAVLVDALFAAPALPDALDAYHQRRRGPVRRVQDASAMLGRLGEVRSAALRAVRDSALRLVLGRFGADRSMRASQQEEPTWLEQVARRRLPT